MLQVHVVTDANRYLYEREVDEHHRIRHRIYIEELHWRGLTPLRRQTRYDQFDTAETV
jgi:acyl-homoserine lactone synthase